MKSHLALAFIGACFGCGGDTLGGLDGGGTDAGSEAQQGDGATCSKAEPCGTGLLCGYDQSEACTATTGECFPTGALCNTFQPGCACDGTTINVACTGLPNGYTTAPLAHVGLCDGGK